MAADSTETVGAWGAASTGCSAPFAVAKDRRRDIVETVLQTDSACPRGSTLHGQKCLRRYHRGHGRYHRSVSSAPTDRPVSDSSCPFPCTVLVSSCFDMLMRSTYLLLNKLPLLSDASSKDTPHIASCFHVRLCQDVQLDTVPLLGVLSLH